MIGLGSNLPFTVEEGSEVLDFLGEDRTIYWVNTYGRYLDWQDEVNGTISELGEIYDNVTVLDWSAVAPDNPEWIRSDDGIHLTPEARSATPPSSRGIGAPYEPPRRNKRHERRLSHFAQIQRPGLNEPGR